MFFVLYQVLRAKVQLFSDICKFMWDFLKKIAEWYLGEWTIPAWHAGERKKMKGRGTLEKAAFPILQAWRIQGGNAECGRREKGEVGRALKHEREMKNEEPANL